MTVFGYGLGYIVYQSCDRSLRSASSWKSAIGSMTHVHLKNANVTVPIYDSQALRLINLASFRAGGVGTNTASVSHGAM